MLQIIIWALCVALIGIGHIAMYVEKMAAREKAKKTTGLAIFLLMFVLALVLFYLSFIQGGEIQKIISQ